MTDRELMQQALEALEVETAWSGPTPKGAAAITALRERLAQPEQDGECPHCDGTGCVACDARCSPRREWQGLTEEEVAATYGSDLNYRDGDYYRFARAIEAKLKEKNG